MNRNTQERFSLSPTIGIQRSKFLMNPEVKTTFNLGDLIPIGMPIEVLPGDTFEVNTALAIRMQPLVCAPMDNISFDYYWFFVPNRILWDHWKEFMGENTSGPWTQTTQYTIPSLDFVDGVNTGTIGDYFGLPTKLVPSSGSHSHMPVSALPFRAFAMIYNEWFRSENLIAPVNVYTDDTTREGAGNHYSTASGTSTKYLNPVIATELGGPVPKVGKRMDYFVGCLPGPQKQSDVDLFRNDPMVYFGTAISGSAKTNWFADHTAATNAISLSASGSNYNQPIVNSAGVTQGSTGQPVNWYVDATLTINQLRTAFQIQKLYEKDARGGTRYREILKEHFNVNSPDASQQIPQYLGGRRIPIHINSVIQTSESGSTPQGNVAGQSLTSSGSNKPDFVFSSTEHGYLICCGAARIDQHTYQQGVHKSWFRNSRLDYYFPVLANISEQPVYKDELYYDPAYSSSISPTNITSYIANRDSTRNHVFGYQEAWAEYRYQPSIVTGEMRSNITNSLDMWHFADDYASMPILSKDWFEEKATNIDRSMAVTSAVSNQFFGDFAFYIKATRPMPMYSIPGLADHH